MKSSSDTTYVYRSTLYDITGEMAQVIARLEDIEADPHLAPDEIEQEYAQALIQIAESGEDLRTKMDGCAKYLKSLEADQKALRDEENRLAEKRREKERKAERFKGYVIECLSKVEGRVNTDTFALSVSQRKNSVVEVEDEQFIPLKFWVKQPSKLDKKSLLAALKEGAEIKGVRLADSRPGLIIK